MGKREGNIQNALGTVNFENVIQEFYFTNASKIIQHKNTNKGKDTGSMKMKNVGYNILILKITLYSIQTFASTTNLFNNTL